MWKTCVSEQKKNRNTDGPEGNGGYGLVMEVMEMSRKGTEVVGGIRRIWKYAEVMDKGMKITEA